MDAGEFEELRRHLDVNNDGSLSKDEMMKHIKSLM